MCFEPIQRDVLGIVKAPNGIIALDADGVLLDYGTAYAGAWAKAFGQKPALRDSEAYWPIDRWEVQRLAGEQLDRFRAAFDEDFWSTIPAVSGAVDACNRLVQAGFDLVCISALDSAYAKARSRNLATLGFPIERVIVTGGQDGDQSPKAPAIQKLQPVAFVDDYLPYHRGLPAAIHKALILRDPVGSPNVGAELAHIDSQHTDLRDFANWWVNRGITNK